MVLPKSELLLFLKELFYYTQAGFSLNQAIKELDFDKKSFKDFVSCLDEGLSQGLYLSDILKNYENFDIQELAILKIGEKNSKLAFALKEIIQLKEKKEKSERALKKALSYPLMVFVGVVCAFIFLVLFVIPKFEIVFLQFNTKLPAITLFLINLEHFLSSYFYYILACFLALLLSFKFILKSSFFKVQVSKILFFLPFIGKVIAYNEKYFFFTTLGVLLRSGVLVDEALSYAKKSFKNAYLQKKFESLELKDGTSLNELLSSYSFFESFAVKMVKMGLLSKYLDELCLQIASYYEDKEEASRQRLLASLEPLATLVVASMVLVLALGVFMPMWELGSAGVN